MQGSSYAKARSATSQGCSPGFGSMGRSGSSTANGGGPSGSVGGVSACWRGAGSGGIAADATADEAEATEEPAACDGGAGGADAHAPARVKRTIVRPLAFRDTEGGAVSR